jgi:hypothetical protein
MLVCATASVCASVCRQRFLTIADCGAIACRAGFYCPGNQQNMSLPEVLCPPGSHCPVSSAAPSLCRTAPGFACTGGDVSEAGRACPPGTWSAGGFMAACSPCVSGFFGSSNGSVDSLCDGACSPGYACVAGSTSATPPEGLCPPGAAVMRCPLRLHSRPRAVVCCRVLECLRVGMLVWCCAAAHGVPALLVLPMCHGTVRRALWSSRCCCLCVRIAVHRSVQRCGFRDVLAMCRWQVRQRQRPDRAAVFWKLFRRLRVSAGVHRSRRRRKRVPARQLERCRCHGVFTVSRRLLRGHRCRHAATVQRPLHRHAWLRVWRWLDVSKRHGVRSWLLRHWRRSCVQNMPQWTFRGVGTHDQRHVFGTVSSRQLQ